MLSTKQFQKARHFILRQGDLLTRKRYLYHFEEGCRQAVLDALACYQNSDGGFGNGLELDLLCPESSGICTEVAFGHFVELGVSEGPVFERALGWVCRSKTSNGDLPHPAEAIKKYPHGEWWEKEDAGRILSIAGFLGRLGTSCSEVSARAAAVFEASYLPFPGQLDVYAYPLNLYLEYAEGTEVYGAYRDRLRAALPAMLVKAAWHHPLFFCHDRWASPGIADSVWAEQAKRALTTLQDDGGVLIEQYLGLPWWRPVWTLDMLVIMRARGLIGGV